MNLNKIRNTCSMLELGNISEGELEITRNDFLIKINKGLASLEKPKTYGKNYTIIFNCSRDTVRNHALKLGFERVIIYKGKSKTVSPKFNIY